MDALLDATRRLLAAYPQADDAWWPVDRGYHEQKGTDARFEVFVGAILTQNTAWRNVEAAMARLRAADLLEPRAVVEADETQVREAIRPAGTFRQKTRYLRAACARIVDGFHADFGQFLAGPTDDVRRRLLGLPGVGPETADAILVYAAGRARFVVDAYTRRIAGRLGLLAGDEPYGSVQERFHAALPPDASFLARAHAAFVEHAKHRCTKRAPGCDGCPLETACPRVGVAPAAQA